MAQRLAVVGWALSKMRRILGQRQCSDIESLVHIQLKMQHRHLINDLSCDLDRP